MRHPGAARLSKSYETALTALAGSRNTQRVASFSRISWKSQALA
jgi:hypothetical protein